MVRKRPRIWPLIVMLCSLAIMAIAAFADLPIRLIWNGSASAPIGLYSVSPAALAIGDFVLVRLDPATENLITARNYLPSKVPVLKRIAALGGDEICRAGPKILINGRIVATALAVDSEGRSLPAWSGCRVLNDHELLLLNQHPQSLDGRYFGPIDRALIIGRALLLWKRPGNV